jgi:hypothetical protein
MSARRRRRAGSLLIVALALVGCGSSGSSSTVAPTGERAAILSVMNDARSALLAGDSTRVCSHLTAHGRDRVMGFRVDYDNYGKIPPTDPRLPQTCKEMVDRQFADAHPDDARVNVSWPRQLAAARFTVTRIAGDKAAVALKVTEAYGPVLTFQLVRTSAGWMIDDSDGVPSGY